MIYKTIEKYYTKKFNEIKSIFEELNRICANRFDDDLLKNRKIIEDSFDKLTIKIKNKNVIIKVKEFIESYKKIYYPLQKFDEKIFLSIWLFSKFPDIVLNPTKEQKIISNKWFHTVFILMFL